MLGKQKKRGEHTKRRADKSEDEDEEGLSSAKRSKGS